jgi:hypothetical protein
MQGMMRIHHHHLGFFTKTRDTQGKIKHITWRVTNEGTALHFAQPARTFFGRVGSILGQSKHMVHKHEESSLIG